MRKLFIDVETTGLSPQNGDRICEIAAIEYIDDKPTGRQYQTYLNPERELHEQAAKVNGLSLDKLKNEPKFHEIAEHFLKFIKGATLVAHNAKFDISFLDNEVKLYKNHPIFLNNSSLIHTGSTIDLLTDDVICTRILAKTLYPNESVSLDSLCNKFNIDISHRAIHGAMIDVKLLANVFYKMAEVQKEKWNKIGKEINNV